MFDAVQFNRIYDLRLGPDGRLYVLDSKNFCFSALRIGSLMGFLGGMLYLVFQRNLWLAIITHGTVNTISFALAFIGIL